MTSSIRSSLDENAARTGIEASVEGFLEAAPDAMVIVGGEGHIVRVNGQTENLFGYDRKELIGQPVEILVPDRFRARHPQHRRGYGHQPKTRPMGAELELNGRRKDGTESPAEISLSPLVTREGTLVMAAIRDITARRQAEHANARLAAIVESSADAIVSSTSAGTITSWNQGAQRLFGYTSEEVLGTPDTVLIPADRSAEAACFQETMRRGDAIRSVETKRLRKDGTAVDVSVTLSPIRDAAGSITGSSTILRDISEWKKSQEKLEQAMAQLASAQGIAHVGSWDWDLATRAVNRSDELCRIFGIPPGEPGTSIPDHLERVHPDDRERVREEIESSAQTGEPAAFEYRIVRPDGVRFLQGRRELIRDGDGKPARMIGTVQDVTERKQIEARLLLSDRMASVGTLAAGVAHELNNPLGYVAANVAMAIEEIQALDGGSSSGRLKDLEAMLSDARDGVARAITIVRGLKTFSRVEEARTAVVDLLPLIELSISMTFNEIRHRARLVTDFGAVPLVDADEGRLGQVFINLLVNAAQALPQGGAANEIRVVTSTDGAGRAVVEVRDNGHGISPVVLPRIFDPFFTTKPVGVGTGLGLTISHNLVSAMGGELSVQSEVGHGATFTVTLPASTAVNALTPPPPEGSRRAPTSAARRASVLVVDDEPTLGVAVRRVLRGHDVAVVTRAEDALELLAAGKEFDVILSDLMMPGMSGMDLHDELARVHPKMVSRVVFVTGGAFTREAHAFLDRVPNERMEKPFDTKQLRATVEKFAR